MFKSSQNSLEINVNSQQSLNKKLEITKEPNGNYRTEKYSHQNKKLTGSAQVEMTEDRRNQ